MQCPSFQRAWNPETLTHWSPVAPLPRMDATTGRLDLMPLSPNFPCPSPFLMTTHGEAAEFAVPSCTLSKDSTTTLTYLLLRKSSHANKPIRRTLGEPRKSYLSFLSFSHFLPTGIFGWMWRLTDRGRISDLVQFRLKSWLRYFPVLCLNVDVLIPALVLW